MNRHDLTYDDVVRIVQLVKSSEQFSEFRLKVGEIEIELRRRQRKTASSPASGAAASPVSRGPEGQTASADIADVAAAGDSSRVEQAWPQSSFVVRAPMVGTFYVAPEPGAPPFVRIGQVVEPDTTVCIIEVMKLMNSIPAQVRGIVSQVLVEDGTTVQADTPLIILDPVPVPE